jgi:hypothetical protein
LEKRQRGYFVQLIKILLLLILLIIALSGCWSNDDYSENPWGGYATKKSNGKPEWWFGHFKTREECLEDLNWGVENTVNAKWYTVPVGCGFISNSRLQATLYYIFYEEEEFKCLSESKNPETRKIKGKYGPWLKGYPIDESRTVCVYP